MQRDMQLVATIVSNMQGYSQSVDQWGDILKLRSGFYVSFVLIHVLIPTNCIFSVQWCRPRPGIVSSPRLPLALPIPRLLRPTGLHR